MRRCKICDAKYDPSRSFVGRLPASEDTCPVCEIEIMDTIEDYLYMDKAKEDSNEDH